MQKKIPDITIENVSPSVFEVLELTGCTEIFSINVATEDVSTYLEMSFKNFLTSKATHSGDKIFTRLDRRLILKPVAQSMNHCFTSLQ